MKTGGKQNQALVLKHKMQDWIGTRKQVQFWLNLSKQPEMEMLDIITWFKSKGLFRGSVMRGLRVMFAYYHNDFEAVFTELPNLKSTVGQVKDDDGLKGDLDEIKRLLREATISQPLPAPPADYPVMKPLPGLQPVASNPKPLAAPSFALPAFDDEDDELPTLKLANSTINTAANLVNAAMRLQH